MNDRKIYALKKLFAFGIPGGKTKVQKAIGKYLDGDDNALDKMPTIRQYIDEAIEIFREEETPN